MKCVHHGWQVPVYDFSTHSRKKQSVPMYGANVIVFEGRDVPSIACHGR